MTQLTTPISEKPGRIASWLQNPMAVKELRSRMRGRRAYVVLTVYLLSMSSFISLIYLAYAASANQPHGPDPGLAGKVIFATVLGVQAFLVVFIGPAFTVGSVTGEKERQTYDLLRTTLLSPSDFVRGKLISALSYIFLLILTAVPLQGIAFLLGGVSPIEIFIAELLILVSAVAFAMIGLYFSSAMRSTLAASVATFGGAMMLSFGIPAGVILFGTILGSILFTTSNWLTEILLAYGGLALASFNLPATLIVSDIFLVEEDALFFIKETISGHTVYLPSPWPFYILLYTMLTLLAYWASVRRVNRIAER